MPENNEEFDYTAMADEIYMEHIEGPRIEKEKEQQEFRDHITKTLWGPSMISRTNKKSVTTQSGVSIYGIEVPDGKLSPEDLDMIYEQEHLQFLMDHNLFYWKLDRFMLQVEDIPPRDKIAQDRYLAHGARKNLLELWKKKEDREKRNLIDKDS